MRNTSRGFIALTSVLILSAVLLMIVIGSNVRIFYARFNALEREYKAQSLLLAQACVAHAEVELLKDRAYAGNEAIALDFGVCDIGEMEIDDTSRSFTVQAEHHHAETTLEATFDIDSIEHSVREIP